MADARQIETELVKRFEALGAQRIEADILQPAETLLDLYGENIRGRAYVTQDPLRGEQMLRPDFTVPVVQMHMAASAEPARYTYAGPVFRRQETDPARPTEYPQVGYEVFDRGSPERVEAGIFKAFNDALVGLPVTPVIGDMAILTAALDNLDIVPARRAALRRHLWHADRFRDLLDRFERVPVGTKAAQSGPAIGLRSEADVAARLASLESERAAKPLGADTRALIDRVLGVAGPAPAALDALEKIRGDLSGLAPAVARFEARLEALENVGIATQALQFEVSYGRTSMEYYDGFVFGFSAPGIDAPIATGGRYDALTRILGQGRHVPAVGGVIRPDLVAKLQEVSDA